METRNKAIRNAITASAISVLSIGCAVNPEKVKLQSDTEVCRLYGAYKNGIGFNALAEQYLSEIKFRKLIKDDEWSLIRSKKIKLGMSLCSMYASWGAPDRENKSTGRWGVHIQHIYNSGLRYIRPTYVYSQNGKVTSWQD